MAITLQNAMVYENASFVRRDVRVSAAGGAVSVVPAEAVPGESVLEHCWVLPGFADVHVHLREPGFSYKETIASGTRAAARGGYTAVCAMPNLSPAPDSLEHLAAEQAIIDRDAVIPVYPYGTITRNEEGAELADLEALAPYVTAFSDDGRGVQSAEMMEAAMLRAKALGKLIVAHCEDNRLLRGGYIHDGAYARVHGHKGICSESEWGQIARDLELAAKTGCAYHVCHISTRESVALIRQAKRGGVDVTCETAPHYLALTQDDLQEDGRFKMNPPLRDPEDRDALIQGLLDGTIDMIITDHAPHSREEKAKGLAGSAMGVVGLETAFAVLYTTLVRPGILPLEKLVALMAVKPRKRFRLPVRTDDITVFSVQTPYRVDPEEFLSQGRSTPFAGMQVLGRCKLTAASGKLVWADGDWAARL